MKSTNFSIISKTLPDRDIIAANNDIGKDLEKEEADMICAKVSRTLQNSKPLHDSLSKNEGKSLKELQFDTSIVISHYKLTKIDLLLTLTVRTIWKNVWIIKTMLHINYLKKVLV